MSEPIWSTGGTGGERAVTGDLEWAVHALRAAADDVSRAHLELARRRAALELDPSVGQLGVTAELAYAERLAPALEAELDHTARRLSAVVGAFVEAERRARYRVGALGRARDVVEDEIGGALWGTRVVGALALAGSPLNGLLWATGHGTPAGAILPDSAPPTTGTLDRDTVEGALALAPYPVLVAAISALTFSPLLQYLTAWRGHLTATIVHMKPARSTEDIMRRLRETESVPGGAVRIERWTGEDGVTRRIVYIPGTEDWLNISGNPFDSQADLELAAGNLPDAAGLVAAALEEDDARPGEPVMLAGHSLGGTLATALAANPALTNRFTVQAVVTAGSPVGRIALPASVNALHLEGTRDIVPGLDGRPNPDTPTRTTVHHDARDSQLPELAGEGEDIGSAHHLDTYAQTARLVDHGLSPSTDAWLSAEREFLQPGAHVVVTEYRP